jgi:hypothetical protein
VAMLSYTNSKTRTNKLIGNLFEFDFGKMTEALKADFQVIIWRRVCHGHVGLI